MMFRTLLLATAGSLVSTAAFAACEYENEIPISSLSAGFEAWYAVTDAMAECGNFEAELDQEFRTKQPTGFAADPSLYHIGGVANGTLVPLLNDGTIRPLNDLVEQYGEQLTPNQLISIDGDIMAIAMMVNTQHLMYRQDIFDELGLEVPTTYDEMLETAAAIQEAGVVDYPVGGTYRTGWNLAEEFVNMYLGFGGSLFNDDKTPSINNENGVAALEMMQALTEYMDPEYLGSDSTYVQQQFQQGDIAMAVLWASRAGAMDDPAESQVVEMVTMAAAPSAVEGGAPASTVWWDGIVIAENISDEEAAAAFQVAMEGMDAEMVQAHNDAAIWLIDGYEPNRLSEGAIANLMGGTPAYPASTEMGLMHTALGDNLSDFLIGAESAEQALADAEEAYLTAARESGLVQ
ncbi:MAG: extracellular solute-binding protein [Pseudomonadota bacterium]